ncbi:DUF4255 domain-containing protein (plasmid) [Streptomyces clavuligerus]|uniref:Pvc16 N-terminal domain-containing protein n=1 Tax=Streptomyces clavuligerus TaxID=1901 RepID=D5SL95_STRCL|nr:DUF4255 domain-containing protein [Streptomyces clavuligerus]ANW22561.1 hypothetical protein BB341_30085 [Streptomyces clavuligerus]AXU16962.1 DUF4255 domain-containing protein [Streptomyces clavuligerus]EFG04688.1 Hypothetical protein SCLAV_p1202 [Streptomyces clavuligerus]MBY6306863.1 DUF4255 domain-containing protein [Streptomyces clavuligerus]QCS10540.1 DUF4255 domain-containing protein [Streptomyces clavuligerus]
MIHEMDEALRRLLRGGALPEGTGEVAFDAPTRDWAARRNAPTVNAYLYDIREDVARRERGARAERDERGVVVRQRQPMRWYRLSYLVTAWTTRPEDEHRLLSGVLATLLPHETLPAGSVPAALSEYRIPIPLTVAVPPAESRSLADIWSALGGELKPSLDVVITTPFPVTPVWEVGPPVTEIEVTVRDRQGPDAARGRPRVIRAEARTRPGNGTERAGAAATAGTAEETGAAEPGPGAKRKPERGTES